MPAADPDHYYSPHWTRLRESLRRTVGDKTWRLWLDGLQLDSYVDGTLTLVAPADRRDWIEKRFARLIAELAGAELGCSVGVVIGVPSVCRNASGGGTDIARAGRMDGATAGRGDPPSSAEAQLDASASPRNPRLTFEQFVIGDGNRFAHAACLAVAEMPGLAYNPLYICGPPGLGKTHLLHSIANYVESFGDGMTCRYVTGEAFTNHFLAALHHGAVEVFKAAFRGVNVLLVDDVQFLERKAKTEEEFFHTFNTLLAAGSQIVLTSDRPPRDLAALEDRLRERFAAGLVADVAAPDFECRLQILRKRVQQDGLDHVGEEALDAIAVRIADNIRMLEGALIRVVASASLTGRDVTGDLVADVLDDLHPAERQRPRTIHEIQQRTAAVFGVSVDDLVSKSRAATVAWPRQVAMFLARELTDHSLPAIGRAFGNRNHTTVLAACRRTAERMGSDADAFDAVTRLTAELQATTGASGTGGDATVRPD